MTTIQASAKTTSFIIRDVQVYTGHESIHRGFVLVCDGVISQFGSGDPSETIQTMMPDLLQISAPGNTLMPGLIDAHIHALGGNIHAIEEPLRFGVTTVCDMHNEHDHNMKLTKLAQDPANLSKYADFKCAGLGAMINGGWPEPIVRKEFEHMGKPEIGDRMVSSWPKLTSPSEASAFVTDQIDQSGSSYIKLMHEVGDTLSMDLPRPPMAIQRAVVEAAHENGLIAVGHALSYSGAMDLIEAGVDGLTHIFLDAAPNDEWVRAMKEKQVHCNPTLSLCASQTGEGLDMQTRFVQDPLAKRMMFNPKPRSDIGLAAHCHSASEGNAIQNTKALYQAGIPLIVGSDSAGQDIGSSYGMGVHMEMYRMVADVGMEPMDVLRSATSLTAERFGFADRGSIKAGARADLVLVEGDVLQKLEDRDVMCLPIIGVWRDGVMADAYRREA